MQTPGLAFGQVLWYTRDHHEAYMRSTLTVMPASAGMLQPALGSEAERSPGSLGKHPAGLQCDHKLSPTY